MFLKTKTEVYNSEETNLGLTPDYVTIEMLFNLEHLVGVRQFVVDGKLDRSRCVVILQTGEEYGILTPFAEVVALLAPPVEHTSITNIDDLPLSWVSEPTLSTTPI